MLHQFDQHGAPLMRKGLATTSLILGTLSVLTLGLGIIGAIMGIVLGMVALSKIRTDPHLYGRKNFAVGGIVLSALGLLLGIGYGFAVGYRYIAQRKANESKTVAALQTLKNAQNQYAASHRGNYATPDQLVRVGLIDNRFIGDFPVLDGYVFTFKVGPRTQSMESFYAINADPLILEGLKATGRKHFYTDSSDSIIHGNDVRPAEFRDPPL